MSKRIDPNRTCYICGDKHHKGKKWSKIPNKFFPNMDDGFICAKHYTNEHSKKTFQEKRKGNKEFQEKRRKHDRERYQNDNEYRESFLSKYRKGGKYYTKKQAYKKKWSLTEKGREGSRRRNKKHYHKDPERQCKRIRDMASSFSRQYTYLKKRAKCIGVSLMTKNQFFLVREIGVCEYCKKKLPNSGPFIDRLDSRNHNGYDINNCVPCCDRCNKIKGQYVSPEEMIMFSKIIRGELPPLKIDYYSIYQQEIIKNNQMKEMTLNKKYSKLQKYSHDTNAKLDLSKEKYKEIIARGCAYCKGPVSRQGFGLDKIIPSNTLGYCTSNVNPCCPICNQIKNEFLTPQTMEIMISVISYFRKNPTRKNSLWKYKTP